MVTVERQNEFRIQLAGATIARRMELMATRGQDLEIIDAKAARPSEAHVVQVMLFLHLQRAITEGRIVTGEVY